MLWLPVLIGVGIALYFSLPFEPPPWIGLAACVAAGVAGVAWRGGGASVRLLCPIALAGLAVGFAAAQARTAAVAAPVLAERLGPTPIFGRIVRIERLGEGRRMTLDRVEIDRLAPADTPARVRLRLPRDRPELAPGDRVRCSRRPRRRPPLTSSARRFSPASVRPASSSAGPRS